jgi:hypothetical protein
MSHGPDERFVAKVIPDPGFSSDDGAADPALRALLAAADGSAESDEQIAAALLRARLLVPVVAVLDEAETGDDGRRREKSSHMATVTLRRPDGSAALLAFTGTDSLAGWDPAARPIAATGPRAAAAVIDEGADALLIDLGSAHPHVLVGARLESLARGLAWTPPWRDPAVASAVHAALLGAGREPAFGAVSAVRLTPDDGMTVMLELDPFPGVEAAEGLARRASAALAALDVVRARCDRGLTVGVAAP